MNLTDRIPPQNIAAEMCVLGSGILDYQALAGIVHFLDAGDFYRQDHAVIYEALLSLYQANVAVDLVVLRDKLETESLLEQVGGVDYLVTLVENVPSTANIEYYAQIVKRCSMSRSLVKVFGDALSRAYRDDPAELVQEVEAEIFKLTGDAGSKDEIQTIGELSKPIIAALIEQRDKGKGLATGYGLIDRITGGLHPGESIVIAGRTAMGKTALALNIAAHVSFDAQEPALIFSLEMSVEQLVQRFIVRGSGVDSEQIRTGLLGQGEISRIVAVHNDYVDAPLYIDASPYNTPLKMLAKARHMVYRAGIKLVVIDYLQLVSTPRGIARGNDSATYISNATKHLARELNVPVILISQLSRAVESREGHRPRLADLRDSGSIEQDADIVMLLYRADYYETDVNKHTSIGEVIIAKQRQGPTGTVDLCWDKTAMSFRNIETTGSMF